MKNAYSLLLSPRGRIGRVDFLIGLAFLIGFVFAQKYIFSIMPDGLVSFFLPMTLFFLTFHIVLCVYGKRLHDMGYTIWPLTGLFFVMIIAAIMVMLNFGGLEYFNTVIAHPEYAEDEAAMKQVQQVYQNTLAANMPKARILMTILPGAFSVWLLSRSGQAEDNQYGSIIGTKV